MNSLYCILLIYFDIILGTQYQQYRIIEFAPQKSGMPKQKLSIRSAEMHIRIEKRMKKRNTDWEPQPANVQIEHMIDSKRRNSFSANLPRKRIKIWVFRMTHGVNITSEQVINSLDAHVILLHIPNIYLTGCRSGFPISCLVRSGYGSSGLAKV